MGLSAEKSAKLQKIEKNLLMKSKKDFDYLFYEVDSVSPGTDANGMELTVHRRLFRSVNLTHDLFESQQDYNDWHTRVKTNYLNAHQLSTRSLKSSTTPYGEVVRTRA